VISDTELLFGSPKSKISNYDGYQGNIIAPNEQKIIDIFNKFGPILNWWDLNELASNYNVSEASLNMMLQFSVLFKRIDRATYVLSNKKLDLKNIKTLKVDISIESYSPESCEYIEKEHAYIEVYDFGNFKYNINYPRPLRKVMENYQGIKLDNKIYIVS
jgi:hypothetical protein